MPTRALAAVLLGAALCAADARADDTSHRRLTAEIARARAELHEVELQLETLKRLVPADAGTAALDTFLRRAAERAELPPPTVVPMAASEVVVREGRATGISRHRTAVSGRAAYAPLHLFLSMLGHVPRPVDLESLDLEAASGGTVTYRILLVSAVFAGFEDPPVPAPRPPAASTAASPEQAAAAAREAFLQRELDHLRARTDARRALISSIVEHTGQRRSPRLGHALGLLTRALENEAVALSHVAAGHEIVLRGVTLGEPAQAALRAALVEAGFGVDELTASPSGRCRRFVATVRLVAEDPSFAGLSGNGLFDDQSLAVCEAAAPPLLPTVTVQGHGGPLSLRLQEADVADLFARLHESTSESFVLDADLQGRVTVSFGHTTVEEVLGALPTAGLRVGPGPLRRVSFARSPAPASGRQDYAGDPVSLSLRHVELLDLLRLLEEITGLPMYVAAPLDRRVSVFARELPWDLVLDSVISAAGLSRVVTGDRVYIGSEASLRVPGRPGFVTLAEATAPAGRREWWTFAASR